MRMTAAIKGILPKYSKRQSGRQLTNRTSVNWRRVCLSLMCLALTSGCSSIPSPLHMFDGASASQGPAASPNKPSPSTIAQSYHDATRLDRQMNRGF